MSRITLNAQKCYCIGIDITANWHSYPICDSWLNHLKNMISKEAQSKFSEHLSSHNQKSQLLATLKIIYLRLSGALDNELGTISDTGKAAILTQLQEDILNCSNGFHDRANYIVQTFTLPRSINDFLYNIRKQIVEKAALKKTNEIHANNRFSIIANASGYGIHPHRQQDPHPGEISDTVIEETLNVYFKENYSPLNIISSIIDNLKTHLLSLGYTGKQTPDKPYTWGIYSKLQAYLCLILDLTIEDLPLSSLMLADEGSQQLIDINWLYVNKTFFRKLIHEQYFLVQAEQADSLDNCYEMLLIVYEPDGFNKLSLAEKCSLLQYRDCLLRIAKDFPQSLPLLLNFIQTIFQAESVRYKQLAEVVMHESNDRWNCLLLTIYRSSIAITSLWSIIINLHKNGVLGANQLAKLIMSKNFKNKNCLALSKSPEAFLLLLNILFQLYQEHILSFTQLMEILMPSSSDNWNCLAQAAFINPEAIDLLWEKLRQLNQAKLLSDEQLAACVTQIYNHLNCLTIAIRHQPAAIKPLWEIISELHHKKVLQIYQIANLFLYNNCLMFAIRSQADSIEPLFEVIQQILGSHQPILNPLQITQLFLQKTIEMWNCLMLAVLHRPNSVASLWRIIQELVHRNILSSSQLADLIMQKDSNMDNSLMLAAQYQFKAIEPLWAIIQQLHQGHILSTIQLKELCLQTNNNGMNHLMLALRYNPEAIEPLLTIMKTLLHERIITSQNVEEIFSKKNQSGWSALIISAYYHPKAIISLLGEIDPRLIAKMIMDKNSISWNCLIAAIHSQSNICAIGLVIEPLMQLLHKNMLEAKQIAEIIMHKSDDGWNCLMHAVQYRPGEIKILINFLKQNFYKRIISLDQIAELFMQKSHTKANCLMLAAHQYHASLQPLLEGIDNLFKDGLLRPKDISSIFLQKSEDNFNCLNLSVDASWQSTQSKIIRIKPLLESIQSLFQGGGLNANQVNKLLLQKIHHNSNFLTLAAEYHPTTIAPICESILSLHRLGAINAEKILELILQENTGRKNSLIYAAKYGPDAINPILNILIQLYEYGLDLKRIKRILKLSGISAPPEFAKKLLDVYIKKTEIRVQQGNFYRTKIGFWKCGYSATRKLAAAKELRQSQAVKDLSSRQGELGNIRRMLRAS